MRWKVTLAAVVFGMVGSACSLIGAADGDSPGAVTAEDWAVHGGDSGEQRFSTLSQIDSGNVGRLKLAWYHDFDSSRGEEATPLVIDGVLYTSSAWSRVAALDAATGKSLWTYDPKVSGQAAYNSCCDVVNRGVAHADGRIFLGALDGRLIALDAKTGKPLWSTQTVDPARPYAITGAPRVAKGLVFIGNSGAELGVRGYVSAYDQKSGRLVWRFYTVPGDPSKGPDNAASDEVLNRIAAPTWSGRFWESGAGGTVWDSIVYDAELDRLYIGVGNGTPWNHVNRSEGKGDNLFLSSIMALDPATGRYLWHYQETPGESWDFTSTQQMTLATVTIGGKPRKVIMHAPKNGFFYVIDRDSGKLISAEKFVPANWADRIDLATGRPVENPAARYLDKPFLMSVGGAGGHNWQPMSYSPKTGLVYIPAQELPMIYERNPDYKFQLGGWNNGIKMNFAQIPSDPAARKAIAGSLKGRLLAWNPVTQKPAWSVEYGGPWNGGVLSTAGNLVFQGTARGEFLAYDAATGRRLWQFAAQSGVMAGPISYSVNGRQFIAVLAGYGGAVGLALPAFDGTRVQPPGRILVFALDGTATLPEPPRMAPASANPTSMAWPAAVVARGSKLYTDTCSRCHALGNLSAGVVPDLRRSGALTDAGVWRDIVIGGALADNGMVSFARWLTPDDAEAIRAFVDMNARELKRSATGAGR